MPIFGETSITKLNVDDLELTANANNGAKKYLLDLIYPIGSIYIYQGEEKVESCPIALTLGGTWTQIENRFLYATASKTDLGKTGGRNNAWFVGHKHYTYDFDYLKAGTSNIYLPYIELDLSHNHTVDTVYLPLYSDKDLKVWTIKVNESIAPTSTMNTSTTTLQKNIDLSRLRGLSGASDDATLRSDGTRMQRTGFIDLLTKDADMLDANMPRYTCVLAWKRTA